MFGAARAAVFLLALAAPASLWAQWETQRQAVTAQISARSVGVTPGSLQVGRLIADGRIVPAGASGVGPTITAGASGGALVRTVQSGPGPVSPALVGVTRTLTRVALAKAIVRGLPLVGSAITIAELIEDMGIAEGPGGTVLMDPGGDQIIVGQYRIAPDFPWSSTRMGAATAANGKRMDTCLATKPATYSCVITVEAFLSTDQTKAGGQVCLRYANGANASCQGSPTASQSIESNVAPGCPEGSQIAMWDITKCTSTIGEWLPVEQDVAADRIVQKGGAVAGAEIATRLIENGAPVEHGEPDSLPESPVQVGRETTTHPDGSVTVRDTSYPWVSAPGGYGWTPRIREETFPPGAVIPPPVADAPGGTTTEGKPPEEKQITCGLPDTPPCKIDESGMPPDYPANKFDPVDDPVNPLRAAIENPEIADVSFTWAFQLPAACSPIPLPGFGSWIESIDICPWQPAIHDVMSVFWLGIGILGAWGMLSRAFGGS